MASKKKKSTKKNVDDWDKQISSEKLAIDDDESSVDDAPVTVVQNRKILFNILAEDSVESDGEEEDNEGSPLKKVEPKAKEEDIKSKEKTEIKKEVKKDAPKTKGKKGRKQEPDDLDAILAELEKEPEKPLGKGKKKGKKVHDEEKNDEQIDIAVKLAESKELSQEPLEKIRTDPEKQQPDEEGSKDEIQVPPVEAVKKKKEKKKKKKAIAEVEDREESAEAEEKKQKAENEEVLRDSSGDETTIATDKKAKKKKKDKEKKEKEKDAKDSKKKKHLDMIKLLLRQQQEEREEILRKQKEEEERLIALQKAKEEEERLAREKKEKQKQKKKEREEQLKAEGKYMSATQREKLRKQKAILASDNIVLPAAVLNDAQRPTQKRPVYGKKKPKKELAQAVKDDQTLLPSENDLHMQETKVAEILQETEVLKIEEDIPESWDVLVEEKIEEDKKTVPIKDQEKSIVESVPVVSVQSSGVILTDRSPSIAEESESEEDESSSEAEEESSDDEQITRETKEQIKERVKARFKKRREIAESKRTTDVLRAPVICVLGHVDTGKTKMLDTIRRTNVQDGEAGGITQQIGATQVPAAAIKERTKMVRNFDGDKIKIPGFLIIDTPGHESFSNLRTRGSSLCDYAILVVDIMHGIEPQTLESLRLLLNRKTPFVIALNKIDRLYEYESNPRKDIYQHLKSQSPNTQLHFKELKDKIVVEFAEQGVNVALANENRDLDEYISMVPTSAFLGDGIGNLMAYVVNESQIRFAKKLAYSDELECFVMEVKSLPGLGTTIDVILVNGVLSVGDIVVLSGSDGAVMTQIRELLMPQPLRELRVKNAYEHFQSIKGSQGVKILAKGLEKSLAGLPMYVARREDEIDFLRDECEQQLSSSLMAIKKKPEGVYVQASTLGSLEALLEFLKTQRIPYSNVNIGPVHKKDVQKAAAMRERKEEYACILAFDVRVDREVEQFAASEGVRIFTADIIYHLEDNFLNYREELRLKRRRENEHLAIFPCKLRILPQHIFNTRDPIVIGVSIESGQLKRGTPLCVPSKDRIFIGSVSSIERNHDQIELVKKGEEVCIKIENTTGEAPKLYGRHFNHEDILVSKITRETIDVCKAHFRSDLSQADWHLVIELKKLLDIM